MVAEQSLFHYAAVDSPPLESRKLTIELGDTYLSYCISNPSGSSIQSAAFLPAASAVNDSFLTEFLSLPDLATAFDEVILVCNTKEKVLIPSVYHSSDARSQLIEAVHGDLGDLVIQEDEIHQWELYVIYGCNRILLDTIYNRFPHLRQVHFDTACLRHIFRNVTDKPSQWIMVFFYPGQISVAVVKEGALQILQCFHFDTPHDVVYHLLHVCERFQLDCTTLHAEVSGMIDAQSEAWREIQKYIVDIELESNILLDTAICEQSGSPVHYFTPFLIAPSCV